VVSPKARLPRAKDTRVATRHGELETSHLIMHFASSPRPGLRTCAEFTTLSHFRFLTPAFFCRDVADDAFHGRSFQGGSTRLILLDNTSAIARASLPTWGLSFLLCLLSPLLTKVRIIVVLLFS
jgi:hypothetical protein